MPPAPLVPPAADPLEIDREVFQRMLSLGGAALRPALVAQLLDDFTRLGRALDTPDVPALERAAHELKGLAATIGARALAAQAEGLQALAASQSAAVRGSLALGLRLQVDRLCAELQRERQTPSAA